MIIKCIIVEDEPLAVEVIEGFINQVPFLELVAKCNDAFSAMEILKEKNIDLIFLDIHLPKLKGLDFLSAIKNPPMVIITTAYHEFAIKSYEYNVIDYLLKPIEFSRFVVAVNKVLDRSSLSNIETDVSILNTEDEIIYFNVNKKKARIELKNIVYFESQRENIKVVTTTNTFITRHTISDLEKQLPSSKFIRIHRSFIVAKAKIDFFDANDVVITGKEIPIGRSYKESVFELLSSPKK